MKANKVLLLSLMAFAIGANAASVSVSTARIAAASWARSNASLGVRHGTSVGEVTSYDVDATPGFYAVALDGGGMLFLSADDEMGPVIAFTAESSPDLSAVSPLRDLLERDVRMRRGNVAVANEKANALPKMSVMSSAGSTPSPAAGAKAAWAALTASSSSAEDSDSTTGLRSMTIAAAEPRETIASSDIRVEPLVQSQWSQQNAGGGYCYNYYTPSHYPCGCVATAAAQIMRFWNWPAGELDAFSNICTVNNETRELTSVDSPNPRVYDWGNMKLVPASSATEEQREAIGRLTSDIGVALGAEYASNGTGAMSIDVSGVFRTKFAYQSGVEYWNNNWQSALNDGGGLHSREGRNKVIYACLDAGLPVQLAIADGNGNNGHAVVCDGYGFVTIGDVETEFAHINMGWAGSGDMWYNIPDIDSTVGSMAGQGGVHFQIIKGATFNIAPEAFGELLTGRITDDGDPVANAVVTAYVAGTETVAGTCMTDAHGIYALKLPPSGEGYDVRVVSEDGQKSGAIDDPISLVATEGDNKYAVYNIAKVGNSWGNDIDIVIPYVRIGATLYPNLNTALAAAEDMEDPVVEIFGPTRLRRPVTITTNMTICVVADAASEYPTVEDCLVSVDEGAITMDGWALQVADGAKVVLSNVVFATEAAPVPHLDVLAGGTAAFAGKIGVGTVKVQDNAGFVLAGVFEPVGAGLAVAYSGAADRFTQFGVYECSAEDAASCANLIADALDQTLTGSVGEGGALVWDRIPVDPSVAIAYATDATIGTTYYRSIDLLFNDYTNGAEVVFLKNCPADMFTKAVNVSKSLTMRSEGEEPVVVTAGKAVGFTVQGDVELMFTNIVFKRTAEYSTSNLVTVRDGAAFTMAPGAVIADLKLAGSASAVYVDNGTVAMQENSAITNCVASGQASCKSAGIYLKEEGCSFNFAGGLITGCKAGHNNGGGAVYAEMGATLSVCGSATAYGNKTADNVRNIYVAGSDRLILSGELTGGEIGVYCYGGITNGATFATVGDGVAKAAAISSSEHFSNDWKPAMFATASDDGSTFFWSAEELGPRPVPEAEAEVQLIVGSSTAAYATISNAFEAAGMDDARIELLRDVSLSNSIAVAGAVVLDGRGFTLTRAGDFYLAVTNTSLTVTNVVLSGGTGEGRMLDVLGGVLCLESGAVITNVLGSTASMVAPVVVWNGSFVMNSGAKISGCINSYAPEKGDALTAGAVMVNGQNAVAEFFGGTISGCVGGDVNDYKVTTNSVDNSVHTNFLARSGGVTVANEAQVRICGDLTIKDNVLVSGEARNLVVHDLSRLVLVGPFTGRVGYMEGILGSTNVFGTVDADYAATTTASNLVVSARRFRHDVTEAKGLVVTNDTETLLVWDSAVGDSSVFTNTVGDVVTVYDVVLVEVDEDDGEPEIVECAPFAVVSIERPSDGKWKLTLKPGTEHCVYTLKRSDDLNTWTTVGEPKVLSASDIFGEELEFVLEMDGDDAKKFWKVEGTDGIK